MPIDNPTPGAASAFGSRVSDRVEQSTQRAADSAVAQVREVRARAESGIEEQRNQIAERVRRIGAVLRDGSAQLGEEDAFAQDLLDQASDRVQRAAEYIHRASPQDVVDDLGTLARTRPGLFFGGAFLVGLAVGRFAKSSQTAQRDRVKETRAGSREPQRRAVTATSTNVGSAAGTNYSAPRHDPPEPQSDAVSDLPRAVLPGEGTKT